MSKLLSPRDWMPPYTLNHIGTWFYPKTEQVGEDLHSVAGMNKPKVFLLNGEEFRSNCELDLRQLVCGQGSREDIALGKLVHITNYTVSKHQHIPRHDDSAELPE